jgi:serine protease Do
MALERKHPSSRHAFRPALFFLLMGLACLLVPLTWAADAKESKIPALPPALEKAAPEGLDDLKAIQKQVNAVLDKVLPCTVGIQIGGASGSGVLVNEDGTILTAGHVSGKPGSELTVILSDGRRVKGKSLGANHRMDSGMIKITEEGKWPFAELGNSAKLKRGQWCLALGHPGGYKRGRPPVVRLGRVLNSDRVVIRTDCTLVGGDSGGPLFDLEGKVIAIHSSIGGPITANQHVPADTYRETWDRLVASEEWGGFAPGGNRAWMGVQLDTEADGCKVAEVQSGSPADKAGLKANDVIVKFAGEKIGNTEDLAAVIGKKKPGDKVTLEVMRGDKSVTLDLTLGKREG